MQICLNCLNNYQDDTKICPYCGFGNWHYTPDDFCLNMGILLKDRYKIGTKIGAGGFGITYRAVDMQNGKPVAIKEYFPNGMVTRKSDHRSVQISISGKEQSFKKGIFNFLEEAKGLARFRGVKNIVQVYDFFEQNGTAYIVMEYLRGRSLSQLAAENNGRIDYNKTLDIMSDVIDALEVVHSAGMVHRDISPDNIFIRDDGVIKLIDFGAARESWGEQDKTLSIVLKPSYAPPEQFRKKSRQGPWTDIYALGATMYKVLTGNIPPESVSRFVEDDLLPPSVYVQNIPQAFDGIIMKMMALQMEDRYPNVSVLRNDLLAVKGNLAYNIQSQPGNQSYNRPSQPGNQVNNQISQPVYSQSQPKKKNIGLILLICIVAAALIILVLLIIILMSEKSTADEIDKNAENTVEITIEDNAGTENTFDTYTDEGNINNETVPTIDKVSTEDSVEASSDSSFVDYGYFIYEWNDTIIYISDYLFSYSVEEIISGSTLDYEKLASNENGHEYQADISLGTFDIIDIDGDADKAQACMIYGSSYTAADTENVLNELTNLYGDAASSSETTYMWEEDTTYVLFYYDEEGIYLIYMTPEYWEEKSNT